MLTEWAPAKVNLYLHVLGRRVDGYHRLDSLAVFAGIGDEIRADADADLSLQIVGEHAGALLPEPDNLVLRAARALAAAAGQPAGARLVLDKRLPVAAGIGGGSADAAATLRLLVRLWRLRGIADALGEIAARLGADVPVCLGSRPGRLGGIGERLDPAPSLPPFGLVLANPGVPLATADVFRARGGAFSSPAALPAAWADAAAMARDLARLANDLQPAAIALCPVVGEVLATLGALPNCLLARMSGSGATCFALFPDSTQASDAAARLSPRWWRWGGAPAPAPSTVGDPF